MKNKDIHVRIKNNDLLVFLTAEQHYLLNKYYINEYSVLDGIDLSQDVIIVKDYQINKFLKLWYEI